MFNNFKQRTQDADPISAFNENQINRAEVLAKSLALKGLPKIEGDVLSSYTGVFTESFRNFQSQMLKPYAGDQERMGQSEKENLNSKKERLERQLNAETESERMLILEKDSLTTNDYEVRNTIPLYVVIFILSFGEAVLTRAAFALYELASNLFQAFILIFFTVVYAALPHVVIGVYKGTDEMKNKHFVRIGLVLIVISTFFVFAVMRTGYLQNIGDTTMRDVKAASGLTIQPWYFICINLMFIVISCYATSLLPDTSEKKSNKRAKQLDEKIREARAEIQRLEKELDAIPDKIYAIEQRMFRHIAEAETIKQRMASLHVGCITSFISTNTLFRPDHTRCSCFDDVIPSLI